MKFIHISLSTLSIIVISGALLFFPAQLLADPGDEDEVVDTAQTNPPLMNPIGDQYMTTNELVIRMLKGFLGVLSLIALVMVIYGGFQYVTSAGNPEQIKKAKDTIIWALLGMAIGFMSLAIINFVLEAFSP
ncbi:pilin [Patescibacteria group bacterium]|nr:pilin [Patescibacteria group bacterium]MBU1890578.1 pilin [Patescibacteria group bacterium]